MLGLKLYVGRPTMRNAFHEKEVNDRCEKFLTVRIMNKTELLLKIFQGIVRPNSRDATEGFTQHGKDGRADKSFYSRKKWMNCELENRYEART